MVRASATLATGPGCCPGSADHPAEAMPLTISALLEARQSTLGPAVADQMLIALGAAMADVVTSLLLSTATACPLRFA